MTENSRDYISELAEARQNLAHAPSRPSLLKRFDFRVSMGYGIIATIWILFSDHLLAILMTEDLQVSAVFSVFKGLFFVWISVFILFSFVRSELRRRNQIEGKLGYDLLGRKQAEENVVKLNRILSMLSDINQAIVHIRDSQTLFEAACKIAVEKGAFRMAWIGLFDAQTQRVTPVAYAGVIEDYLEKLNISLDDSVRGRGPTGQAIHTQKTVIVNNTQSDPLFAPWRDDALRLQYNSTASLPFVIAGQTRGILGLYHHEAEFFDAEELKLMEELAGDITFALEFVEQENQRKQAEDALKHYAKRLEILHEIDSSIITASTTEELVDDTLKKVRQIIGCERAVLVLFDWDVNEGVIFADDGSDPDLFENSPRIPIAPGWDDGFGTEKTRIFEDLRLANPQVPVYQPLIQAGLVAGIQALLMVQGVPIGLLGLNAKTVGFFTDEHKQIATEIASQLAIAIRQLQLSEEIQRSESQYRLLAENMADVIWVLDAATGRFTYVSPSVQQLRGYTPEEVIAQPVTDALTPDSLHLISDTLPGRIAAFRAGDAAAISQTHEIEQPCKGGWMVWTEVVTTILQDSAGSIRILGVTRDISERKVAEEAQRKSEVQQRAILSALPDIMFRYAADGTFLDYHAPDDELLTAPAEMFIGKKARDVIPQGLATSLEQYIKQVIDTKQPALMEYSLPVRTDEREIREYEARLVPVNDDEVLGIIRDVTERVLAERELKALYNATSYLFKADSLLNLGHQIVAAVVREFEHADCGLLLLDKAQNKIVRLTRTGQYDIQPETPLTLDGHGLIPQALRTRQIVYAPDVSQEPNYVVSEASTQSEFVIPLKTANGVIGVLDLQHNEKDAFSERDRRILIAYAERAAPAIETMQLYEELNRHAADLEWRVAQRTTEVSYARERAEAILNSSTDAIVLFDSRQRIQQGNTAFYKLFGIQVDEYFEKPLFELLQVDDAAELRELLSDDQNELQGKTLEVHALRKNGSSFEAELSIGVIKNNGLVFVIRDVTARKQAERAVAEERNLLRTLINALPDFIYVKDLNHKFILGNLAIARMYGLESPEHLIGKDDFDFLRSEMAAKFRADEDRLFQTLEPLINIQEQTIGEQRNLIWVETTKVLLRNLNRELIGLVGVSRDITERKERERQLEFDAAIQASISDAVIVTDTDFNIRSWNKAAEMIYGWRASEVIGEDTASVMRTQYESDAFRNEVVQNFLANGHWEGEFVQRRKDEGELYIQSAATLFKDENDSLIGIISVNRDITKQKQAEAALRDSEQMLVNVIENIPIRVFWKDQNSVFQGCNSLHARSLGLASRAEIVGKVELDFTDPEYAEKWRREDREVMETGVPKSKIGTSASEKDGSIRWLNSNKVALRNADGQAIGVLVMAEDITERIQAEQALRDSEMRFGLLVNGVRDYAIYLVDTEGKIVTWNLGAERIKGYSAQEIIGQHISRFYTREDIVLGEPERVFGTAAAEGHYTTESIRVRKDGSEFWAEVAVTAIKDSSGNLLGFAKVTHDLTERRKAQETQRLSEERYRLLAENTTDIISRVNPDGVYIDVSPSGKSVWGYSLEEMIGKNGADFIHPDDKEGVIQKRLVLLENRSEVPLTYRFRHRDGHYIWLEATRKYIISKETNSVIEYVTSSRDVTIRKRAEEALKNALEKEKELSELKSRFASMASHEFRTPLATILAASETLSAYRDKLNEDQIAEKLTKIGEQVGYLKAIIEDTLQVARLQDPKAKYDPVQLDIDAVCRSVIDEFESRADVRQHFVYTRADSPQLVHLDRKLIRQIINNLLSNAVKYSEPETTIWITLEPMDEAVVLKVRDEGIGIPAADLKHLFEPFHRAANVGTVPGTGLGLVIAKEAVELQGGLMSVESKVDEGTTFTITIPFEFAEGD